jgi:hypothetical protein
MCAYRLGTITVQDEYAGSLVLEGDGFAAAGEISTLLVNPAVARYLGLSTTDAQSAQQIVSAYRQTLTDLYRGGAWAAPSLDPHAAPARAQLRAQTQRLLGPQRAAALDQLSWRVRDGFALVDDDVAETLRLTPAQRTAIAEAAKEGERDNQDVLRSIGRGRLATHQPIEDAGHDASDRSSARLLALLTAEQRHQFDRMKRGES